MFTNILPDPINTIDDAGISGGVVGPGVVTVSMSLNFPVRKPATIGGRSIINTKTRPYWQTTLNYNPLTFEEFAPVYNFTLEKKGSRKSFYVSLPQYHKPKNTTFATFVETATITVKNIAVAGVKSLQITEAAWSGDTYSSGLPTTGDVFTISDSTDSLHKQSYMISHIDTHALNEVVPDAESIRLHFFPGLQKAVPSGATVVFENPLFKMNLINDVQEYGLDNDNLYSFSLKLEEALY
jgi:hypothetical protein